MNDDDDDDGDEDFQKYEHSRIPKSHVLINLMEVNALAHLWVLVE